MEKLFIGRIMFNQEVMDAVLAKCKKSPEYLKVFEGFMEYAQRASMEGMTVNEMANICMMGYAIGEDPALQEMIRNMLQINKMGLDIVED